LFPVVDFVNYHRHAAVVLFALSLRSHPYDGRFAEPGMSSAFVLRMKIEILLADFKSWVGLRLAAKNLYYFGRKNGYRPASRNALGHRYLRRVYSISDAGQSQHFAIALFLTGED